ncbi:hypothetical protein BDF14DRAFT_1818119 [Spinellus fusiger]|nr:hypothetical protein BDF14DRAFT_1818119 [Spinellus fusiger]
MQRMLQQRRELLEQCNIRFESGLDCLKDNEKILEKNIKMHQQSFHQLNSQKKELIADLFSIYPIEQKSYDDLQQFCIRGVSLPNSVYTGCDDEMIATALGFTAHLVAMLAFYLGIPLRYPIRPMGSRATLCDMVSLIGGSRDFPLYAKGVDRYRFEFGVFLLNKNIEQLMNAYGLIVIDLRHTLPNIHYFIQAILTTSVTSGPTSISVLSISSYANHTSSRYPPSIRSFKESSRPLYENASPSTHHYEKSTSSPTFSSSSSSFRSSRSGEDDSRRLTLQPTIHIPNPPSPSKSTSSLVPTVSVTKSLRTSGSPTVHSTVAFIHAPQAMASSPILDTVTTSSRKPRLVGSLPKTFEKNIKQKNPLL